MLPWYLISPNEFACIKYALRTELSLKVDTYYSQMKHMAKIKPIIFHTVYGALHFQLSHFFCGDYENMFGFW